MRGFERGYVHMCVQMCSLCGSVSSFHACIIGSKHQTHWHIGSFAIFSNSLENGAFTVQLIFIHVCQKLVKQALANMEQRTAATFGIFQDRVLLAVVVLLGLKVARLYMNGLGAVKRKQFQKSEINMEVGGWVKVSVGFLCGKSPPT